MVQSYFHTGMYVVDQDFHIVNVNPTMSDLYPSVKVGDLCYRAIALQECQCEICPLKMDNALFYNPIRKEWIHANATVMDYPGHGQCYNVQFQIRQSISDAGSENLQEYNMDEHIRELSGGTLEVCAIGGYCDPGSPLAYANDQIIRLLGYEDIKDLHHGTDGLVSNTIHPDDLDRVTKDLTRCAQNGGTFETTYRVHCKDHSWLWVVGRGKRVLTSSGHYVLLCVLTDMTQFVKRQTNLQDQNMALLQKELTSQAVLENMPSGYHQCANAPGWPFLYVGTSFEIVTGWTKQEIQENFDNLFINMVLPEDIPLCTSIMEDVKNRGYGNAVYRMKKKGGGYIWVSDATMQVDLGENSFSHGTLADVTVQIEELEKAKRDAEASNLAKSTFLFNASHDIRTPMNAIHGFAHIIEENAHDPQMVLKTVQKLKNSSNVLLTLMNDILELSRIEQGKETVNLRPLDMLAHVDKLNEMMVQEMEASGILFRMENQIQHPLVLADDLKLTRIAMNFLSNAKKFTPAGGSVTFGVAETDYDGKQATYTFFVRDTGIGMSQEFQERAFEQFERERSSTVSGVSGSGLGLAITKKLTTLVGGTCSIESTLGEGTTITCSVPLTLAEPSDFQRESVVPDVNFTGKRMLLVEDNDFNREIAHYVFAAIGFEVEEAVNGVMCIEKLTSFPAGHFDCIMMDIQMPTMDGYTATREIRRHHDPEIARTPIIAMTANAFEEDRRKCLDVGMNGHISKPMDAKTATSELIRVLLK